MADNLLQMIYEWVIWDAVTEGLIDLPGFLVNPMARSAWLSASWVGDAPGAINEKDAAQAAVVRIDAGLSDRQTEAAEMSGRDWNSEIQPNRAAEKRRLDEDGMAFEADPSKSGGTNAVQEEGGQEEGNAEEREVA